MHLGAVFAVAAVLGVGLAIIWNFVPAVRDRLKTYTTVLEAGGALLYTVLGDLTGGIQDAVQAGYVPSWLVGYLPAIFFAWFLYKRFATRAPVGSRQ